MLYGGFTLLKYAMISALHHLEEGERVMDLGRRESRARCDLRHGGLSTELRAERARGGHDRLQPRLSRTTLRPDHLAVRRLERREHRVDLHGRDRSRADRSAECVEGNLTRIGARR